MQPTSTVDLIATLGQAVPRRSHEQRMSALEEANRIRTHRAELKRQLRDQHVSPIVAFEDPDCETMKVVDLLLALPKVGRIKAHRALSKTYTSPSKTIGGLSDRQRREILAMLPVLRVHS